MPSRRSPEASTSAAIVTTPPHGRSIVNPSPSIRRILNGYTGIVRLERSQGNYSVDPCRGTWGDPQEQNGAQLE